MLPQITAWIFHVVGIVLSHASNFFCALSFDQWMYVLIGVCATGFLMLRGFSDQLNR
jgi:hypothetical protein